MEAKLIQFSVLLILQFVKFCSCNDTITISQTLKEVDLLISKQNNFALGFFSPGNSKNKYLGIWFYKVSLQTVVWVANRNNPISGNSTGTLSINKHGNLALFTENNNIPVWSTAVNSDKLTEAAYCSARLLDTGNLVLVQPSSGRILWQSFDYPTNTQLQGMRVGLNLKSGVNRFLTSWKSPDDPGTGDYSAKLNPSGSPQFYLYNRTQLQWRTSPWPWRSTQSSYLIYRFVKTEDGIYDVFYVRDASSIARIVMDDTGFLRWLKWNEKRKQWKEFWSSPKDRCDLHGHCGDNSICDSNTLNKFECGCLPGFEPNSPEDWELYDGSGGCIRKRLNSSSVCGHGEGFVKMESVKVPDSSTAIWFYMTSNQIDCERKCKSNCSCSAYSFISISENRSGCLTWYEELKDTRYSTGDLGYDLYVRVDALELAERQKRSSSVFKNKGMLSILILSAASAWSFLIIISVYFCINRMKKRRGTMKSLRNKRLFDSIIGQNYYKNTLAVANELEEQGRSHEDLEFFSIKNILAATDNFSPSNKIGEGGFGAVYKGQLANGKEIAVKRLSKNSTQGVEEFKNEAMLIAKLQHRNLVKLVGCCIYKKEQMLIYEYMPNKSLDSFLFDQTRKLVLDWGKRFNIIVGIARGILYLHQDSRLKIIHRDLKCSNILLDAEMNPKISDFGMARIFKKDQIHGKTNRIVGTYGYMSPEYAVFGKFSVKSDVFSFGIILLEIISGKKNNSVSMEDPSISLIGQVWELWSEDRALEIVDSSLTESYDPHEALRCIQVGLLCVQEYAGDRPTMLDVVLMLKSEAALPSPNQPAFIFRTTSSDANSPSEEGGHYSVNEMTITEILSR